MKKLDKDQAAHINKGLKTTLCNNEKHMGHKTNKHNHIHLDIRNKKKQLVDRVYTFCTAKISTYRPLTYQRK